MPKENKSKGRRGRRGKHRQCSEPDNEIASGAREPLKPAIGSNRWYSPFPKEATRKEPREAKGNMIVPSVEGLHSISGGIIENGIKYIMFPLHLLRFCIFGASISASADRKDDREAKRAERNDKDSKEPKEARRERKEEDAVKKTKGDTSSRKDESCRSSSDRVRDDRSATSRKKDPKEEKNDGGESSDEMVTAEEDSDSSGEQWCTANNTMMVLDHGNIDGSMSYATLEEPMDISMEEHTYDKTHSAIRISQDSRRSSNVQNNVDGNICLRHIDEQDGNSSVDDEISRIFQKQCTSSEDEFSPRSCPKSFSSCKYEKTKQSNYLSKGVKSKYSPVIPRSKKGLQDDERERKKKTSEKTVDVFANSKRRKVVEEKIKSDKHEERKSESKTRENKRGSRQDTATSKHKSHSSRTPVKNRESKRKDIKYKEMATQTDSSFSDDDVEMIPVDAKTSEKLLYGKYGIHESQLHPLQRKEAEQESNYVADNEDSTDGLLRIAHKRISSGSTSSSSTDLGFDERVSATSDTDIAVGLWRTNSPDSKSHFRTGPRAPPGFPEIPQNPPLTSYVYNDSNHFMLTSLKNVDDLNRSLVETVAGVPPAPSPMRHLYYDYPEFMDLPAYVNTSKILNNILKNNYNR